MALEHAKIPQVQFNKNGYEIRADILALAKEAVVEEYKFKYAGWEVSAKKDEKTGEIVSSVSMPDVPGLDKILEAAEKMYSFVNAGATKK